METDPRLLRELRNGRYLVAMAILWAGMSICMGGDNGLLIAGFGFFLVAISYYAGPARRKE